MQIVQKVLVFSDRMHERSGRDRTDDPSPLRDGRHLPLGQIAHMRTQRPGIGVRSDDHTAGMRKDVPERRFVRMGNIDPHADALHVPHSGDPQFAQTAVTAQHPARQRISLIPAQGSQTYALCIEPVQLFFHILPDPTHAFDRKHRIEIGIRPVDLPRIIDQTHRRALVDGLPQGQDHLLHLRPVLPAVKIRCHAHGLDAACLQAFGVKGGQDIRIPCPFLL